MTPTSRNAAPSRARSRRGFTLIEMMISVTLLGIIGSMLTIILVRQQKFHRAVASITDARARMRDIATIVPTDLRGVSTIGSDVMALSDTSLQFRAFVGSSVLCSYVAGQPTQIDLPPRTLAATAPTNSAVTWSTVLTAWINPPEPNDIAFVYNDSTGSGNADDSWTPIKITDTTSSTTSSWCATSNSIPYTTASDNAARRYRITLASAPNTAQIKVGAPIRFAREVRYSAYQSNADGLWYVGYQKCTPNTVYGLSGTCGTREVLAGPILPGKADTTTSGLFFVYWDQNNNRITSIASRTLIARVTVGIRTSSESIRSPAGVAGGDSIRFTIGIRNRI